MRSAFSGSHSGGRHRPARSPFPGEVPAAEVESTELQMNVLDHGRTYAVSAEMFASVGMPTPQMLADARHVSWDGQRLNVPGITSVLDPSTDFAHLWTAYVLLLTCFFIAFIEPIFIALNDTIVNNGAAALIDFVAGASFFFDIAFNFCTGVYFMNECVHSRRRQRRAASVQERELRPPAARRRGRIKLVLDRAVVAGEYVRGLLVIDVIAALPWVAQVAYLLIMTAQGHRPTWPMLGVLIRSLRFFRIVRLAKLFMSRRALMGLEARAPPGVGGSARARDARAAAGRCISCT